MKNAFTAFFFDVSAAFELSGTDTPAGRLQAREIQTRSALAVTFYRPAATAERFKGAWAAEKPPYLTLWAQLPREKSVKTEQHTTHTTNAFGAEG